jgi:hypothetical protein
MTNRLLFAIPLASILGGLSLLHAYWALGGRWGSAYTVPTIGGRRSFDPSPFATWIVCGLLGGAALIVVGKSGLGKSGWIGKSPLPVLFDVGIWGLALVSRGARSGISGHSASSKWSEARPLPIGIPGSIHHFAC